MGRSQSWLARGVCPVLHFTCGSPASRYSPCQCPGAAETNSHEPSSLEEQKSILSQLWRPRYLGPRCHGVGSFWTLWGTGGASAPGVSPGLGWLPHPCCSWACRHVPPASTPSACHRLLSSLVRTLVMEFGPFIQVHTCHSSCMTPSHQECTTR